MSDTPLVKLIIPAQLRYLNLISANVTALLEREPNLTETETITYDLKLALQEAATNIVRHAYNAPATGNIEVSMRILNKPHRLLIELRDQGENTFTPETDPKLNYETLDEGGMGWFLLHQLLDNIEYSRESGNNKLQLSKNLS